MTIGAIFLLKGEAPEAVQEATENQTAEEERKTEAQDSEEGKVQESYTEAPGNSQETDDSSLEKPYEDADTYFAELQALEEKEQELYASIPGPTLRKSWKLQKRGYMNWQTEFIIENKH